MKYLVYLAISLIGWTSALAQKTSHTFFDKITGSLTGGFYGGNFTSSPAGARYYSTSQNYSFSGNDFISLSIRNSTPSEGWFQLTFENNQFPYNPVSVTGTIDILSQPTLSFTITNTGMNTITLTAAFATNWVNQVGDTMVVAVDAGGIVRPFFVLPTVPGFKNVGSLFFKILNSSADCRIDNIAIGYKRVQNVTIEKYSGPAQYTSAQSSVQFTSNAQPSEGLQYIDWRVISSPTDIATISGTGLLSVGANIGILTVLGTSYNSTITSFYMLTVVGSTVPGSIVIDTSYIDKYQGRTLLRIFTTPLLANPSVLWSISNTSIASIDGTSGLLSSNGSANGIVTITATSLLDQNIKATKAIHISNQLPEVILINSSATGIYTQYNAQVYPADVNQDVWWQAYPDSVGDIDIRTGYFVPRGNGVATITAVALANSISGYALITISGLVEPTDIQITSPQAIITSYKESVQLGANFSPAISTGNKKSDLIWEVAPKDAAFIDGQGLFIPLINGVCTVVAISKSNPKVKSNTVLVNILGQLPSKFPAKISENLYTDNFIGAVSGLRYDFTGNATGNRQNGYLYCERPSSDGTSFNNGIKIILDSNAVNKFDFTTAKVKLQILNSSQPVKLHVIFSNFPYTSEVSGTRTKTLIDIPAGTSAPIISFASGETNFKWSEPVYLYLDYNSGQTGQSKPPGGITLTGIWVGPLADSLRMTVSNTTIQDFDKDSVDILASILSTMTGVDSTIYYSSASIPESIYTLIPIKGGVRIKSNKTKDGSLTIVGTSLAGGSYKTAIVNFKSNKATNISLSSTHITIIGIGNTIQLSAQVLPTESNQRIKWTSSDASMAIVDSNALVKAIKVGVVTITAQSLQNALVKSYAIVTVIDTTTINNNLPINKEIASFDIYPNPAIERELTIIKHTPFKIIHLNVYSISGENISYESIGNQIILNKATAGIYIIKITTAHNVFTKILILE